MNDDVRWLRRYVEEGSEEAFAEVVRRHLNLVWAVARRLTGDGELARDVAQTVFADLARKARHLPPDTVLPAWLHRAAWLAASKVIRSNRRRAEREGRAMNDARLQADPAVPAPGAAMEPLLPQLDEALAALSTRDRDAVVLRFLAGKSLAEVGGTLGVNPDTARKRVARALDRLRAWFSRRGVETTTEALTGALVWAGSQTAPAGLAATLSAASLSGIGTLGILETLALMKTKLTWTAVAVATVATPLTYQQVSLNQLRAENRALQVQVAEERASALAGAERAKAAADPAELERARADHLELIRLRGEVGRLRADLAHAAALEKELLELRATRGGMGAGNAAPATALVGVSDLDSAQVEAFKATGIAKLNALKQWGLALHLYAAQHDGHLPATLAAARPFLQPNESGEDENVEANDGANPPSPVLEEQGIEIAYQGRLPDIADPASTILAREREPWPDLRGRLSRTYVFADGHSEIRSSASREDMAAWERERGVVNP